MRSRLPAPFSRQNPTTDHPHSAATERSTSPGYKDKHREMLRLKFMQLKNLNLNKQQSLGCDISDSNLVDPPALPNPSGTFSMKGLFGGAEERAVDKPRNNGEQSPEVGAGFFLTPSSEVRRLTRQEFSLSAQQIGLFEDRKQAGRERGSLEQALRQNLELKRELSRTKAKLQSARRELEAGTGEFLREELAVSRRQLEQCQRECKQLLRESERRRCEEMRLRQIVQIHEKVNQEIKRELERVSRLALVGGVLSEGGASDRIRELEGELTLQREMHRALELSKYASAKLVERYQESSEQTYWRVSQLIKELKGLLCGQQVLEAVRKVGQLERAVGYLRREGPL